MTAPSSPVANICRDAHSTYILRLGDTSLILGHRLSEWCGHGPVLEEDIALSNIALDLIGQSRLLLSHAGTLEGKGRDEDQLAFTRDVLDWKNLLIVEQPNGDFAATMARQFLIDCYHVELYTALSGSSDSHLAAIAAKSLKEVIYHRRHSGEWVIRLGDGTEESHRRLQTAFDDLWIFVDEFFEMDSIDDAALSAGIGVDLATLKPLWDKVVTQTLLEAGISRQFPDHPRTGGRQGRHSEYLGYLLAEMQFMQRAYPGLEW